MEKIKMADIIPDGKVYKNVHISVDFWPVGTDTRRRVAHEEMLEAYVDSEHFLDKRWIYGLFQEMAHEVVKKLEASEGKENV